VHALIFFPPRHPFLAPIVCPRPEFCFFLCTQLELACRLHVCGTIPTIHLTLDEAFSTIARSVAATLPERRYFKSARGLSLERNRVSDQQVELASAFWVCGYDANDP